jgi:hypothetical protein
MARGYAAGTDPANRRNGPAVAAFYFRRLLPPGTMTNVIGILICYSLIVILALPDKFCMPRDDDGP